MLVVSSSAMTSYLVVLCCLLRLLNFPQTFVLFIHIFNPTAVVLGLSLEGEIMAMKFDDQATTTA